MSRISPCYKCKDRTLGCHDRCDRYQAYHAEYVERYQLRKDLALLGDYISRQSTRQTRRRKPW